jgi:predicted nuclease of predicted toxin-antitoxin system
MAIRFHLDENVDHAVARGLRLRGIDVTTSTDADLIGVSDEEQLAFAHRESRVLVTYDSDLLTLHSTGTEHSGIVFCPSESSTIGSVVQHLCLIHD